MLCKRLYTDLINTNKNNINTKYINYIYKNYDKINNIILYGPSATFKYIHALKILENFSETKLKYEKKITFNIQKNEFSLKISDIHYEIDINLLNYNTKFLWNEIYTNIYNIVQLKSNKIGFIVLRNFDNINHELLINLYSYMQKNIFYNSVQIKYIIICENLSFIPNNIKNISTIFFFKRLSFDKYINLCNKNNKNYFKNLLNKKYTKNDIMNEYFHTINTLKFVNIENDTKIITNNTIYYKLCDKLIYYILSSEIKINIIRNILYDILIYQQNIYDCLFYILIELIKKKVFDNESINKILIKTLYFFKEYNNNYRPIFHLESYILYLIKNINENK